MIQMVVRMWVERKFIFVISAYSILHSSKRDYCSCLWCMCRIIDPMRKVLTFMQANVVHAAFLGVIHPDWMRAASRNRYVCAVQ